MLNSYATRPGPVSSLRKPGRWLASLVILCGIVAAVFVHYDQRELPPAQVPTPPASSSEVQSTSRAAVEPTVRYPIPEAKSQFGQFEPLPALDKSDQVVRDLLIGLFQPKSFGELLYSADIVRRLVVTIDNLPRRKLPHQLLPVKPPTGRFMTAAEGAGLVIAPENHRRYAVYVSAAEAVNAKKLVALYIHVYPLFQEQYRALGYPSGAFNDRLIEAIDDLLSTPQIDGPARLAQPRVMYEFADPDLEVLSAGQKIMLRIGSGDAARVKAKLREIRRELIGAIADDRGRQ